MPAPADPHELDESSQLVERTSATTGAPVVLVPLGATEQHGPHLPLDTDTAVAAAVAHRLAERMRDEGRDAVVAPVIAFGSSGEHQGFAGTISIGTAALQHVLVELGRSVSAWAPRLVFVNAHGGNLEALVAAVQTLRSEGRDAAWLPCTPAEGGVRDAHAGHHETSLLLHLRPSSVRGDRAEPGATAPIAELLPLLRAEGVRAVSPNGVLGDPRGANADSGAHLLSAIVDSGWERLNGEVAQDGRLVARGARPIQRGGAGD